ncbi:hypothetical protein [Stieleria varia]|uniref:Uncharacterized protein n=1 Tax=Stieleria varia TaxID=2528005 RepID=A0A5C5ZYL8_9BACT|nr:hypothetical protein [Stieleria varia]TWT92108.1 hypothetical protein Pla52n_64050 [Stieleria varia]
MYQSHATQTPARVLLRFCTTFALVALVDLSSGIVSPSAWAAGSSIEFDMPQVVAGVCSDRPDGGRQVQVELRLSSLVSGGSGSKVDQWIIRCTPQSRITVLDYDPKTELHSGVEGPIKVTQTREDVDSFGIAADINYSHLARGHVGMDDQQKRINSQQYDRVAPLHTVMASGTINRGHGVFFKLRETPTLVLEGEKRFHVTFAIPDGWRGDLLDVTVHAQQDTMTFAGDVKAETVQMNHFVVAVYCAGDVQARELAEQLARNERRLRELASKSTPRTPPWKQALESLTPWNDSDGMEHSNWLDRLLAGAADPMIDKTISRLQMPVRVAVLEYDDTRKAFRELGAEQSIQGESGVSDEKLVSTAN